jgi:hypothetical protein
MNIVCRVGSRLGPSHLLLKGLKGVLVRQERCSFAALDLLIAELMTVPDNMSKRMHFILVKHQIEYVLVVSHG